MDLKQYGGEALRSMASHGNQLLVEYLIQNGADINYHKPDMVFPTLRLLSLKLHGTTIFYGALACGTGCRHHHPG